MQNGIDQASLTLIDTNLELKKRLEESNKGLCKLIKRLAGEGVPAKLLARQCELSKNTVRRIIRGEKY